MRWRRRKGRMRRKDKKFFAVCPLELKSFAKKYTFVFYVGFLAHAIYRRRDAE
jgi:hypothetical protein